MPDPDSSSLLLKIFILLLLILANALFAMSEIAIITLNDNKLRKMAEDGNRKAQTLIRLTSNSSQFLATIQVGVTLSGLLASAVAADSFAERIVLMFEGTGISPALIHGIALVVITILLSYFTLVFGELVPKRIAMHYPEKIAFGVAGFLSFLHLCLRPFVLLLAGSTNVVVRLFGIDPNSEPQSVTEEEIRMMVDVGNEKGVIEESQKDMINNVFEFDDRTAEEVMTHRTDIVAVSSEAELDEILGIALEDGYSRIPVYENGDGVDNIIGIIYVKDLLRMVGGDRSKHSTQFALSDYLRPVLFVPESNRCRELFVEFKQKKVHMAVVVDEYGGTAGIVTMEDLLESIVGNIQDEYDDEEEEIHRIDEFTYSLEGSATLEDVQDLLDFDLPDEDADYDTVSGLIMDLLGRIPQEHERPVVMVDNVEFTVEKIEDRRIAKITARKFPDPEPEPVPNSRNGKDKRVKDVKEA